MIEIKEKEDKIASSIHDPIADEIADLSDIDFSKPKGIVFLIHGFSDYS